MSDRRSPLSDEHEAAGADFTEFGGWAMPVSFDGIRTEHTAVRSAAGKFDVSHMGQVTVTGPDAGRLCDRLVTNDVRTLDPGEACYAAITDDAGIMIDDTIVYRLPETRQAEYLFVPNAGHDREMADRWRTHRERWGFDATIENATADFAMIAVQGPAAPDLVRELTAFDLGDLARSEIALATVAGIDCLVATTGYTGEAGYELLCPWDEAPSLWAALDCQPCGLGARDTLRLEMGFLLSGQDFHPETEPRTPYEAGIGFCVHLDREFVGRDALEGVATEGATERLFGLRLIDRGVPRHGYAVETADGESLGHVTSGTMSPTLEEPIALAYLPREYAEPDRTVRVVIRDEPKKARTAATPFLP